MDFVSEIRAELLPLLRSLCDLLAASEEHDQHGFFAGILRGVENAREPDDLADPFIALSHSAFVGFEYTPLAAMLLDQVLIAAQRSTITLSIGDEVVH